ncbi:MAG: hypothetical protein ACE5F9_03875 [Phycisphaerae bacterium]
MATVGHTLVGLTLSGMQHRIGHKRALRWVWPGLMVLMAHLVDLVEWAVILAAPAYFDQHFVTNSPLVTAGVVAAVWLAVGLIWRPRGPGPYVLIATAIFSHLLLDHRLARIALSDVYGQIHENGIPGLYDTIVSEIWLYGLLMLLVGLWCAARQPGCPRRGRQAAGLLAALAVLAATTRMVVLWAPVYGLAALHMLMLLRRELNVRWLWSLVPITPLAALLAVELWAGRLNDRAMARQAAGDYAASAEMYARVLAMPTRSQKEMTHIHLSRCQIELGEFRAAEETLRHAIRVCEGPYWAKYVLAAFYDDPKTRGTKYERPEECVRRLRSLLDGPAPFVVKRATRRRLEALRRRGVIP